MNREFTCILCPNGCRMEAEMDGSRILTLEGGLCKKGRSFVEQEVLHPRRNLTTSVPVEGGEMPLCSVRLTEPIPKDRLPDMMEVVRSIRLTAPVQCGQLLAKNLLDLGSDLIATRTVGKKQTGVSPAISKVTQCRHDAVR